MFLVFSGPPGSGKTFNIKRIAEYLNNSNNDKEIKKKYPNIFKHITNGVLPNYEDIDENTLDKYYKDLSKYSFIIQMKFLALKLANYFGSKGNEPFTIEDRSWEENKLFALLHNKLGNMDDHAYDIYTKFFNECSKLISKPNLYVYFEVTTDKSIENMKKRGDKIEIDNKYFEQLSEVYLDWKNTKIQESRQNFVVINNNDDVDVETVLRYIEDGIISLS